MAGEYGTSTSNSGGGTGGGASTTVSTSGGGGKSVYSIDSSTSQLSTATSVGPYGGGITEYFPTNQPSTTSNTNITSSNTNNNNNNNNNTTRIRLTAKPHVFAGSVLSPKHAQELTPTLCMAISSALAQHQQTNHTVLNSASLINSVSVPTTAAVAAPASGNSGGSSGGGSQLGLGNQQQQQTATVAGGTGNYAHRRIGSFPGGTTTATSTVPYTLWITEAWRVLGWAEPSAALFWEMATMYHTLVVANRAYANEYWNNNTTTTNTTTKDSSNFTNPYGTSLLSSTSANIPPILSCSSNGSVGSNTHNSSNNNDLRMMEQLHYKKKFAFTASAKELPIWLVSTFLLLHCEEYAYQRNLAGQDDRRYASTASSYMTNNNTHHHHHQNNNHPVNNKGLESSSTTGDGKLDFAALFKNSALSLRSRFHTAWSKDNTHCTAYLLRHLRKVLLLACVSSNAEAIRACMHLASTQAPTGASSGLVPSNKNIRGGLNTGAAKYSANELRRQHDDEHGNLGVNVRLTISDIEHLDLVLQLPSGGGIDDPPLRLGDFIWSSVYQSNTPPPNATIPLLDVEREVRKHLEMELVMIGFENEDKDDLSSDDDDSASHELARMVEHNNNIKKHSSIISTNTPVGDSVRDRAKQPNNQYQKELTYTRLRGTTILLKPNPTESIFVSSGASGTGSGDQYCHHPIGSHGRLHDLVISDCSDAHFYLLQPFEHVTIAACSGCTIVVGAVAGLLHVVDCEKSNITSAARRILVSNSCDVQMYVFSPSPPLLVGDNRSCQFAPYNTYYDGLQEDLIAAGIAAPTVIPSEIHQSPFHGSRGNIDFDTQQYPSLQMASNKWKQPIELSKLEVPQAASSPALLGTSGVAGSSGVLLPGADDKAMGKVGSGGDASMQGSVLVLPSEFNIIFVPLETEASRQRRQDAEEAAANCIENDVGSSSVTTAGAGGESQYCRLLSEVLQLSPFRLPIEYERRALMKAERMKNIQSIVQTKLTLEQQKRFEEELNRGFRDWLVTSGNLRQVLDLVHLERRGAV